MLRECFASATGRSSQRCWQAVAPLCQRRPSRCLRGRLQGRCCAHGTLRARALGDSLPGLHQRRTRWFFCFKLAQTCIVQGTAQLAPRQGKFTFFCLPSNPPRPICDIISETQEEEDAESAEAGDGNVFALPRYARRVLQFHPREYRDAFLAILRGGDAVAATAAVRVLLALLLCRSVDSALLDAAGVGEQKAFCFHMIILSITAWDCC